MDFGIRTAGHISSPVRNYYRAALPKNFAIWTTDVVFQNGIDNN